MKRIICGSGGGAAADDDSDHEDAGDDDDKDDLGVLICPNYRLFRNSLCEPPRLALWLGICYHPGRDVVPLTLDPKY